MPKEKTDPILAELQMIRKLLVAALLRQEISQGQLGGILGLSQQQISDMFPKGALAAFKGKIRKGADNAKNEVKDG